MAARASGRQAELKWLHTSTVNRQRQHRRYLLLCSSIPRTLCTELEPIRRELEEPLRELELPRRELE